jgi:hypothetical protein
MSGAMDNQPSLPRSTQEKLLATVYILRPLISGIMKIIGVIIIAYGLSFAKGFFSGISDAEWIAALIIIFCGSISNKLDDFFDPDMRKYRRKHEQTNA